METILLIILIVLVGISLFFLLQKKNGTADSQSMLLINQRLETLTRDLTSSLHDVRKEMQTNLQQANKGLNERLDNASRIVSGVENKLGKLEESSKRIYEVGKDIASLQEILRAPKLRGTIGELFLGDLLAQMLPKDRYALQYAFKSGEKVDAAIFLKDNMIVPIDSKFPLENFKRLVEAADDETKKAGKKEFFKDVKKHIDAIAAKYILADEGTLDFALMYIPAENVYYETVIKDDDNMEISTYAMNKRVIPVSPNNFYVYIQTILMGLKGMQIEKNVKEILNNITRLGSDFEKFKDDYLLIGKHLGNAKSKFDDSEKRLNTFENKLLQSTHVQEIEHPETPQLLS